MADTPIEIERKYVIAMPEEGMFERYDDHTVSRIEQTYLSIGSGLTRRIRRRDYGGRVEHILTEKRRIDRMSSYESEREISEEEYLALLGERMADTRTVCKIRHTFIYKGKLIEVDIYPEWEYSCIMEIELVARDETAEPPPEIRIIAEVTGDGRYSNAAMSQRFPPELI